MSFSALRQFEYICLSVKWDKKHKIASGNDHLQLSFAG